MKTLHESLLAGSSSVSVVREATSYVEQFIDKHYSNIYMDLVVLHYFIGSAEDNLSYEQMLDNIDYEDNNYFEFIYDYPDGWPIVYTVFAKIWRKYKLERIIGSHDEDLDPDYYWLDDSSEIRTWVTNVHRRVTQRCGYCAWWWCWDGGVKYIFIPIPKSISKDELQFLQTFFGAVWPTVD